ncbi:MAG: aspartate--tRNA ligase [Candidatus Lindowbacteria bacterium RIFCSPLOWO2_12_FULL_62_27]|nr:MAG: aspartate--tRNA ligase [Candidatus Lindowbacteria bacterium RIFCSPLOWO2_12_FULL_62_27]
MRRTAYAATFRRSDLGRSICACGWVESVRDHGGLIFIDLRDRSGILQLVCDPSKQPEVHALASQVRDEWVVAAEGEIVARSPETVNPNLPTGEIEVAVRTLEILNKSLPLPFQISHGELNEEVRLKHRFLDLRRPAMQRNLAFRSRLNAIVRNFLLENDFYEIETPFLTKSTPEGARDFLVPSRLMPGQFYALPQSPQLYKQILMVAGFDRYFQVARCFRDEDLRADRQPEFTQIDIEMSFVDRGDVIDLTGRLLRDMFRKALDVEVALPIPTLSYDDAMARYGSDKPDLRYDLPLTEITDLARESKFGVFLRAIESGGIVKGIRIPKGATFSRKDLDDLVAETQRYGAGGFAYFKVTGGALASNIAKYFPEGILAKIRERMGAEEGDVVGFVAEPPAAANTVLSQLRASLARRLNLIVPGKNAFVWVLDFPLLEYDAGEKRHVAVHHPFTAATAETRALLASDPLKVKAQAYDIVLNGSEIGGGSIRNHRVDWQEDLFRTLGLEKEEVDQKFGFLLQALALGAPPHGGIALGQDRILMLMLGADSIREAIAFPKNQRGVDLCFDAPSGVDDRQLRDLGIQLRAKPKT